MFYGILIQSLSFFENPMKKWQIFLIKLTKRYSVFSASSWLWIEAIVEFVSSCSDAVDDKESEELEIHKGGKESYCVLSYPGIGESEPRCVIKNLSRQICSRPGLTEFINATTCSLLN